jgi:hypothetical protein
MEILYSTFRRSRNTRPLHRSPVIIIFVESHPQQRKWKCPLTGCNPDSASFTIPLPVGAALHLFGELESPLAELTLFCQLSRITSCILVTVLLKLWCQCEGLFKDAWELLGHCLLYHKSSLVTAAVFTVDCLIVRISIMQPATVTGGA